MRGCHDGAACLCTISNCRVGGRYAGRTWNEGDRRAASVDDGRCAMNRASLLVALLCVGCGDDPSRPRVTAAEYGEAWPLTLTEGRLQCETSGARQLVTLDAGNGIHYGLNGSAIDFGFPDGREHLKAGRVPADLEPLITRGLTLCR